jgi:hypothetical protein
VSTVPERIIGWLLRAIARAMLFGGIAMLLATIPVFGLLSSDVPRAIAGILLQVAATFLVGGIAATYLSHARATLLPNERVTTAAPQRPAGGGWLMALGVTLVAAPVWLLFRMQPFLAEWRRVIDVASAPGLWDNANQNMSGVVLMPIAAALTPPFFELATVIGFVVSSLILLPLLLSRSPRFPRVYVVCAVLLTAMAVASVRGAAAAALATDALRQLIDTTSANVQEAATLRQVLERYSIVFSSAPALLWTLFAYMLWLPAVFSSARVAATFAQREEPVVLT